MLPSRSKWLLALVFMVDGVAETLFRSNALFAFAFVFTFVCLGVIVPGFNFVILIVRSGGCPNVASREGPVEASIEEVEWIETGLSIGTRRRFEDDVTFKRWALEW